MKIPKLRNLSKRISWSVKILSSIQKYYCNFIGANCKAFDDCLSRKEVCILKNTNYIKVRPFFCWKRYRLAILLVGLWHAYIGPILQDIVKIRYLVSVSNSSLIGKLRCKGFIFRKRRKGSIFKLVLYGFIFRKRSKGSIGIRIRIIVIIFGWYQILPFYCYIFFSGLYGNTWIQQIEVVEAYWFLFPAISSLGVVLMQLLYIS